MSRVADDKRPLAQPFPTSTEPRRARGRSESPSHVLRRDAQSARTVQHVERGQGRRHVQALVDSLQVALDLEAVAVEQALDPEPLRVGQKPLVRHPVRLVGEQDRRAQRLGALDENELRLHLTLAYDDRSIFLDDPGLLAGDPPERIAKKLRVIVADVRYHAEQRTDHVRRVEPSAHADLDDGHVDLPAREMVERHSRRDFEKRRLHAPDRLPVPLDVLDDLPLGDRLPVDTHALAEIFQMGRREQTGPVSGRRQRRGDQMRHGALAVGPGHMHAAEAAVRNARSLFQRDDAVEPRFVGAAADVLKHRQRAIEKIQCLTVVHPISAFGSKDTLFSALQNEKR